MRFTLRAALLGLVAGVLHSGEPAQIKPYAFETSSGEVVQTEWGQFKVPENRRNPDSRTIELAFVRFKSTNPNPGHPIVYLAGGPGGSGIATARGRRFPLFMALREVADVIAFDQRGTGDSHPLPICDNDPIDLDQPLTLKVMVEYLRRNAQKCQTFWQHEGVDLDAYNTVESAADLEDLRLALGAEKLNLWGISYGTHLAFAAMKSMESRIHRAVLASSEGPDHTVKLPGWTDAYLNRVNQAIQADPNARAKYPDFLGSIGRVMERLDREPVVVEVQGQDGTTVKLTLGKAMIQYVMTSMIKNPSDVSQLPAMVAEFEAGRFQQVGAMIYYRVLSRPGKTRAMSTAMDCASGISAERLALFRHQAPMSLLGEVLNVPFPQMFDTYEIVDLGDGFRANVQTSIPTLFLNGTLDGRTYPEETWELMRGFQKGVQVIVENAGHDLFMTSPEVTQTVVRFFKDGGLEKTLIHVPPPQFR